MSLGMFANSSSGGLDQLEKNATLHPVGAQLLQSGPTLWDLMGCSPPGSYVHGILQARILERVVMPFSSGSSQPEDPTRICLPSPALQADFLPP